MFMKPFPSLTKVRRCLNPRFHLYLLRGKNIIASSISSTISGTAGMENQLARVHIDLQWILHVRLKHTHELLKMLWLHILVGNCHYLGCFRLDVKNPVWSFIIASVTCVLACLHTYLKGEGWRLSMECRTKWRSVNAECHLSFNVSERSCESSHVCFGTKFKPPGPKSET